ncbi:MAG: hypothetical protein U9Q03_02685 [Patescibacteria group bacterium]|nr:hypothetical protein [Patescibacteria group bacterium]
MSRSPKRDRIASLVMCAFMALLCIAIFFATRNNRTAQTPIDPRDLQIAQDETTPEEQARNRLWTLFNSDCSTDDDRTPAFDANLCRTLHPATSDEIRLESLLALLEMNAVSFDRDDAGRLIGILRDGSADTRIGLIRGMNADSELGIRIASLTVDHERMRLFLWGEEIELE